MIIINVDDKIRLELTALKHAKGLFEALDKSREHLSEFLPWVANMETVEDFKAYIRSCELLYKQEKEVSFVIIAGTKIVGRIGLHHLDMANKVAAIGYWLTKSAEGKGIVTKCCRTVIDYGFEDLGLHRIELRAATTNLKSQAIPERLKFNKEGMLREAELVNGKFLDLFIYSMLAAEWKSGVD